jgi:hypothetical protein
MLTRLMPIFWHSSSRNANCSVSQSDRFLWFAEYLRRRSGAANGFSQLRDAVLLSMPKSHRVDLIVGVGWIDG